MSKVSQLAELLSTMKVVDLSHTLEENMPVVQSHSRYYHTLLDSFETGSIALAYQLMMSEHCGTHMDATAHFIKEGHPAHLYMDETPVAKFYGRALTLDFSHYTAEDEVTAEEIEQWERDNQPILPGDIVFFRFGWDRYWIPRTKSLDFSLAWPGINKEAAELLVARDIKVVGCDAIAIDGSSADKSPAHYVLLGNGVNIIENLTRLDQILGESYVMVAPLKVKQGSGAPMRALAFV
jgi:kynurenine formamidase